MTSNDTMVRAHYERAIGDDGLLARLKSAIDALGDGHHASRALAALDHFHVRGPAATAELAAIAQIQPGSRVLDAGSGLGGPSRFLANKFDAVVTGVDLSPAFVEVATYLATRAGLVDTVDFRVGDLTALPLEEGTFDFVWTEHVLMNLANRRPVYAELHRVLKPGGKIAFYEPVAVDSGPVPHYPTPWADTAENSYVLTELETRAALEAAGFAVSHWQNVSPAAIEAFASQPPPNPQALGLGMVMGPRFPVMAMNFARNIAEGRLALVMGVAERT